MKLVVSHMKEGENLFQYHSSKESWLRDIVSKVAQDGIVVAGDLELSLNFTKLDPDYYLRGHLRYELQQPCLRCAEPVKGPVDYRFEMALSHVAGPRPSRNEKLSEESEEVDIIFFHGPELTIDPLVEEQLHLSIPYRSLCRPECLGICQVCGKNLNEGRCQCAQAGAHGAFAVLKQLKEGGSCGST